MSETENKEVKTKEKNSTTDLIDLNVALVLAENNSLKALVAEKDEHIADLSRKLQQATDIIEEDTKSRIITEIREKTVVPSKFLQGKSLEDLTKMKEVLDTAVVPAFHSSTPLVSRKESEAAKLEKVFDEFAAKTWRKG